MKLVILNGSSCFGKSTIKWSFFDYQLSKHSVL